MSNPAPLPYAPNANLPGRFPRAVLLKLIFFAVALAVVPIASYFLSVDRLFSGETAYAGAFAGLVANVIVGAYVVVAILEEDPNAPAAPLASTPAPVEGKKDQ
jgi:vacuolar ATPase assembly integral membrane protein VMA21